MKRILKKLSKKTILGILALVIIGLPLLYLNLLNSKKALAAPWSTTHTGWQARKQLTLVNNSGSTINTSVPYQVNIDTKSFFNANRDGILGNCDDLRVVYQPDNTTNTEIARSIQYAQGATNCRDSSSTIITFPLQAAITNGSSNSSYYIYYANPSAPTYSATTALSSYNINGKTATFVAPFNGTTTALAAGSGTPTTATGAIRYSGAKSAMQFNGVRDNMTIPSFSWDLTNFTIETWIYLKSFDNNIKGIFSGNADSSTFGLFVDATQHVFLTVSTTTVTDTNTLTLNTWHHIAGVRSGTNLYLFVDGVQRGSPATSSYTIPACNGACRIGMISTGQATPFMNGLLDELRLSNTARYTSGFSPFTSPFVRDSNTQILLHMDENGQDPRGSTGIVYDDSGNGHSGIFNIDSTATAASYVSGLVGVDASTTDTGSISTQPYAGHQGVFIEEGTTNKITNPSFEHSTYATGWTAAGSNLTATQNTTAPYYKFGTSSEKLVANASAISGTSNMRTINITSGSTSTTTLSAYVYDGTSGNVGGTVGATIAKLVYNGTAQTTTYTNMGGGWWRLTYVCASSCASTAAEYGVEAQISKTIYVDGVQLEGKSQFTGNSASTSTYADGSLGSGYAWTGTANDSSTTRSRAILQYPTASNVSTGRGTISLWVKPDWNGNDGHDHTLWHAMSNFHFQLIKRGASTLQFQIYDSGFGTYIDVAPSVSGWQKNTWHHVVVRWDIATPVQGSAYIAMDIDGTTTLGSTSTIASVASIGSSMNIGTDQTGLPSGRGDSFATISDLRIYSSALTSTDVTDLYNSGLGSHSEGPQLERNSPVLQWSFDEGQGTTAKDSSIKGNNGTISGATYDTQTPFKQSTFGLKFDGSNDYVSKSYSFDSELDSGTDSFAVSGWFKHSSTISGTDTLISRADAVNGVGYKIYMNSSGYICFGTDGTAGSFPADSACATSSYSDSKWYFVEGVKDGVNNNITLFINGIQISQTALTDQTSLSGSSPTFYVGIDADGTSNPWDGFIDDVKVYPQLRTAAQIHADYNAYGILRGSSAQIGSSLDPLNQGLVGYWKMDETSGTLADASGNSNTGTWAGTGSLHYTTGKFGNGGGFNGTDDFISGTCNSSSSIAPQNNMTLSAWFNYDATNDNVPVLISCYIDANNYYSIGFNGGNNATAKLMASFKINGVAYSKDSGTAILNRGQLYHVAATFQNNTVKLFVNGAEISASNAGWDMWTALTNQFSIGNSQNVYYYGGTIDEARVYNRALSPKEVSDLYNWAPGSVGYWKMDDKVAGDAKTIVDSSGNGNNGTTILGANNTGMDCTKPGKYGGACSFDNIDDQISVPSNTTFRPTGKITAEAWIYSNSLTNGDCVLNVGNPEQNPWNGYYIRYNLTAIQTLIGTGSTYISSSAPFSSNATWAHIAGVYDGVNVTTYVNGIPGTPVAYTGIISYLNNETFLIGTGNGNCQAWDGKIDEVKIYNYARTQKQIVSDMGGGSPAVTTRQSAGPLIYLDFNEGYLTTASNTGNGGTGKNGTLNSSTWSNSGKFGKGVNITGSSGSNVSVPDFGY